MNLAKSISPFSYKKKLILRTPVDAVRALKTYFQLPAEIQKIIKNLKQDDVVFDVGANVGIITFIFAWFKSQVVAIEPHPLAYLKLQKKFKDFDNVTVINAAALANDNEKVNLFLHSNEKEMSIKFSLGSSLRSDKPNVGTSSIEVKAFRLAKMLKSYEKITIIKLDIEGYEVELLPDLIRLGGLTNVKYLFVELHNQKWESLNAETKKMIDFVQSSINLSSTKVFWNWP